MFQVSLSTLLTPPTAPGAGLPAALSGDFSAALAGLATTPDGNAVGKSPPGARQASAESGKSLPTEEDKSGALATLPDDWFEQIAAIGALPAVSSTDPAASTAAPGAPHPGDGDVPAAVSAKSAHKRERKGADIVAANGDPAAIVAALPITIAVTPDQLAAPIKATVAPSRASGAIGGALAVPAAIVATPAGALPQSARDTLAPASGPANQPATPGAANPTTEDSPVAATAAVPALHSDNGSSSPAGSRVKPVLPLPGEAPMQARDTVTPQVAALVSPPGAQPAEKPSPPAAAPLGAGPKLAPLAPKPDSAPAARASAAARTTPAARVAAGQAGVPTHHETGNPAATDAAGRVTLASASPSPPASTPASGAALASATPGVPVIATSVSPELATGDSKAARPTPIADPPAPARSTTAEAAPPAIVVAAPQGPAAPQPIAAAPLAAGMLFGIALDQRAATADRTSPRDAALQALSALAGAVSAAPVVAAAGGAQHNALDMRRDDWPQAMIDRIDALRDAADATSTRITLMPDALGKVDVSLRHDGDTVHVHFAADTAQARTMLADAQPRLADAAQARGIRLGQTSVGAGGGESGRQPPRQPAAPMPSRPVSVAPATDANSDSSRLA
jgi:hypothetical protein